MIKRMKELVTLLSEASKAYYQEDREIMSNFEYDKLYDELSELETKTGVLLSGSPTQKVGFEILSKLPKEHHPVPMLSLDKTKNKEDLVNWLGSQAGVLSWKLDGLTVVLTYENGELSKALTRGNGEIGEVITTNARMFENIPLKINFKGTLVLRGEAVIKYSDFSKVNKDTESKYKNPRNLSSGSVRQLDNKITKNRHVNFIVFDLIQADGIDFENSIMKQLSWVSSLGFDVIEHALVNRNNIADKIKDFSQRVDNYDIPCDGLVLIFNDISYGQSLGSTSKFPRNSIAFKWADETQETILSCIEWNTSKTGLINPVAVFEPVEIEGSVVSRASVHNISTIESLELGIGDIITVYKANMIIPQIADNLTRSGSVDIPKLCPVCNGKTQIQENGNVKTLFCTNPDCKAKRIKSFVQFVSREALNINGLSEATLEKFIDAGVIKEFADIFHLDSHKNDIIAMEGLGQKSYDKLIDSIRLSSDTTLVRVIYGIGIPGVGLSNAKMICQYFNYDIRSVITATVDELTNINGIGEVLAQNWYNYFRTSKNMMMLKNLLLELTVKLC